MSLCACGWAHQSEQWCVCVGVFVRCYKILFALGQIKTTKKWFCLLVTAAAYIFILTHWQAHNLSHFLPFTLAMACTYTRIFHLTNFITHMVNFIWKNKNNLNRFECYSHDNCRICNMYVCAYRTFVTCCCCCCCGCCVELADFCASRDCDCVCDCGWLVCVLAAVDRDDDIVSAVSVVLLANAFVVFDDVSHLSGAFNWPCSDDATFDRLTDDIEIGRGDGAQRLC